MKITKITIVMTSPSPSDQRPLYAGSPNHLASIDKARSSPISQVRIDLQSLKLADHVSQQSCVHIKLNDNTQTQRRPLPNSTHLYELAKVETQNPNDFLRVPSMFLKCRRPLPSHNGHLRHRSRSQVQLGDARESSNHFQLTGLRNKTGAVLRASVSSTGESSSAESTFEDANSNYVVDGFSTRVVRSEHTYAGNLEVEDLVQNSPNVCRLRHQSEPTTSSTSVSLTTPKMMMSPVLTSKRVLPNPSISSETQLRNFHLMKHSPSLFHRSHSVPNAMLCAVPKVTISDFSSTCSTPYSEPVEECGGYPDNYASTPPVHCVTLEDVAQFKLHHHQPHHHPPHYHRRRSNSHGSTHSISSVGSFHLNDDAWSCTNSSCATSYPMSEFSDDFSDSADPSDQQDSDSSTFRKRLSLQGRVRHHHGIQQPVCDVNNGHKENQQPVDGKTVVKKTRIQVDEPSSSTTRPKSRKPSGWRKLRRMVHWTPFIQTYKNRRYQWVQLAGHSGNFKAGKNQGTVLKKLCVQEELCYQKFENDELAHLVPKYQGILTLDDDEKFIQLQDCLSSFKNPSIMDCKIGVRTYLEEELAKAKENPKLRRDMYDKMIAVDSNAPTEEEHKLKGVTKPRYMVWRETISSTATLGFRIEGVKMSDGSSSKEFKTTKTKEQVFEAFKRFLAFNPKKAVQYLERLRIIRASLERSKFFQQHELIGSSLLFVHDNEKASIWLIDFGKTVPLPDGQKIDHKSPWEVGNHEDGYLIGIDNLINIMEQLVALESPKNPVSPERAEKSLISLTTSKPHSS